MFCLCRVALFNMNIYSQHPYTSCRLFKYAHGGASYKGISCRGDVTLCCYHNLWHFLYTLQAAPMLANKQFLLIDRCVEG